MINKNTLPEICDSKQSLIIFDTEWTSWPGFMESGWNMPGKFCEVIQIGAIKLSTDNDMQEIDSFSVLVKPVRNPILSEYITDLTGITQQEIDSEGLDFFIALKKFISFAEDSVLMSLGDDIDILKANCHLHDVPSPLEDIPFLNLRPIVADYLGKDLQAFMSCELPQIFGFPDQGTSHQAIDDSRCIAEGLRHMLRNGFDFQNRLPDEMAPSSHYQKECC